MLSQDHWIIFNKEIKRLMKERAYTFKPSIQEAKDAYLQQLLDCPLKLSKILLPE